MHDSFIPTIFNRYTDSVEHDIECDNFQFHHVFANKEFFVGSRLSMRNEIYSESAKTGFNKRDYDDGDDHNNHNDSSVNIDEWFYSRRKVYHRYLIKLLFCTIADNYSYTVKYKDLLMEWIHLSFYLITFQIDLSVSISQEIRYRIIDNLIAQNLLILFPIPSVDMNDVSIYQFIVTSKYSIEHDEILTFTGSLLGMNDVVSALCVKIIVNYSNIFGLEPFVITDLCINFGLYGCAIKSHEKYISFMEDNNRHDEIDLSILVRILSNSLLILWYDKNYRHVSAGIIKRSINLVTRNLYRYGEHYNDDIVYQLSTSYNEAFNRYLFTTLSKEIDDDIENVACVYCDIIIDAVGLEVGISIIRQANYIVESLPFRYFQMIFVIL